MNSSLTEMVLAIAIAAIVLAMVAVPTTRLMITEQKLERQMNDLQLQHAAALRFEQIGQSIWRTDAPPPGTAAPRWLTRLGVFVGDSLIAGWRSTLYHYRRGAPFAPLARGIGGFLARYRTVDGREVPLLRKNRFDQLVAGRYRWQAGRFVFAGWFVPLDRAFDRQSLALPAPDTSGPYDRGRFSQKLTFDLGTWR